MTQPIQEKANAFYKIVRHLLKNKKPDHPVFSQNDLALFHLVTFLLFIKISMEKTAFFHNL